MKTPVLTYEVDGELLTIETTMEELPHEIARINADESLSFRSVDYIEPAEPINDYNGDGLIQVFIDKDGLNRGQGRFINDRNLEAIDRALDEITNITGVEFEFVDNEWESELSFHKVDDLSAWGVEERAKGIQTRSRDGKREHVYWEPCHHSDYAEFVIFHEIGHAMGLEHPGGPFLVPTTEDVMGYLWEGGSTSYTEKNIIQLQEIYG